MWWKSYVWAIIGWDSLHGVDQCGLCLKTPALWRCTDCLGNHALCQDCCRKGHNDQPFHWIEFWTDTHYKRDWLSNMRVVIHLGHHGSPCPLWEPVTLVGELWPCVKDWNIYNSPSGLADTPWDCCSQQWNPQGLDSEVFVHGWVWRISILGARTVSHELYSDWNSVYLWSPSKLSSGQSGVQGICVSLIVKIEEADMPIFPQWCSGK